MSDVEGTAAQFFAERVREYDSLIHRGVPRYDEMLDELVENLPEDATDILELGCGTGTLTLRVAQRCPEARLTVVDAVQDMVDATREQLRCWREDTLRRTRFVVSAFEDLNLAGAAYDCITSSMSLHHVVDKESLYRGLRGALRPTGYFAFADELIVAVPFVQDRFWQRWLSFARLPNHLTDQEIRAMVEHMEAYDRYETLPRQMELLRDSGFTVVDCVWRHLNYAIFVASDAAPAVHGEVVPTQGNE